MIFISLSGITEGENGLGVIIVVGLELFFCLAERNDSFSWFTYKPKFSNNLAIILDILNDLLLWFLIFLLVVLVFIFEFYLTFFFIILILKSMLVLNIKVVWFLRNKLFIAISLSIVKSCKASIVYEIDIKVMIRKNSQIKCNKFGIWLELAKFHKCGFSRVTSSIDVKGTKSVLGISKESDGRLVLSCSCNH